MGEWRDMRWGDLASLEYGKALRGYEHGKGPYRVYGTNGPIGWHDDFLSPNATVVIGRKGAYRGVHYSKEPCFVIDTAFYLKPRTEFNMRWAYYELLTHEINDMDTGSAIPSTSREVFYQLPVRVPPLGEQGAIAHILGTLDDKVELNRRISEALEAVARAIFKAWFVDFEPVRAKMDGRWRRGQTLPGLPAHLRDLFPDRLVDSELGEIPQGWRVGTFGQFVTQRTERVGDREATVLSATARGKLVRSEDQFTKRVYSEEIRDYILVEQWDVAYNPSRANIGSIGMLEEPIVGAVSPVYVVVRPEAEYRSFLEFTLRLPSTREWINTLASGSVRQSLSYKDFASIPCVIPPRHITMSFETTWLRLRKGIASRIRENTVLTDLRDSLLAKLISGELRVKTPDCFTGRAL